ncbi:STAS domain-containing protein [Streptomyces achromogenes]|uniref:STAS domain-containing protein n=1 Tax=Streptomyces achromogenes TaxID=67255 RepID=UPI0036B43A67
MPKEFTVTVRSSLAGPVLECAGDLHLDTVAELDVALESVLSVCPAPAMMLVDLAAVTFMDSTGLNTLLAARLTASRQGTVVHLARPSHRVDRLLDSPAPTRSSPSTTPCPHPAPPARPPRPGSGRTRRQRRPGPSPDARVPGPMPRHHPDHPCALLPTPAADPGSRRRRSLRWPPWT